MTSRTVAAVAFLLGFPGWSEAQGVLVPRVVVVNPATNPVPVAPVGVTRVTLTDSPSVTVAGPVQVQQASGWSVQILGTPTVRLSSDSAVSAVSRVRTVTVVANLDQTTQCQSLFTSQADPAHPSGQIWLVEAVNGRILVPTEDQIPPIELRAEAPNPNVNGFTLDHYYLGINRAKVAIGASGVNVVFNDRLNAYAIKSRELYPQVCFSIVVDYSVFAELTFTGRLIDCVDVLSCP
jgi:hypothetical protein